MSLDAFGKKTGSYKWDGEKFVKTSPHPHRTLPDAYVPPGGYEEESLGKFIQVTPEYGYWQNAFIETKEQKADLMKREGIVEVDGSWKFNPRTKYFV